MSIIKSISVGYGDMYYIRHGSDNFTIIDCMLPTDDDSRKKQIVGELIQQSANKGVVRFISTHPDQDHVRGLEYLDSKLSLRNFYCVKNAACKEDPTSDFMYYCKLRDNKKKSFYIYKGCSRKWMNTKSDERGSSGINILWPDTENADYKAALKLAAQGKSPNNTSAIIKYSLNNGVNAVWMGDLETEFMEKIDACVELPKTNILFAPHHGRESGQVPKKWLDKMEPSIIV